MCYLNGGARHAGSPVMPASFWLEQAKKAKESGLFVLSISGGESFSYPYIDELMDGLCEMGFLISFNTNGSFIHQKGAEWFLKHPVAKINISLYGASNETYQRLCGCGYYEFDHVSQAIDDLLALGQNVYVTAMMTPDNIDDLPEMINFANTRGLKLDIASYTHPSTCQDLYRFDPVTQAKWASEYVLSTASLLNAYIKLSSFERGASQEKQFNVCNGAKCSFAISYDGKMMPCVMMRHLDCDLTATSFEDAWKIIKEKMKEASVPSKCEKCKYAGVVCPACKGSLYREREIYGSEEYLCKMAEATESIIQNRFKSAKFDYNIAVDEKLFSCSI